MPHGPFFISVVCCLYFFRLLTILLFDSTTAQVPGGVLVFFPSYAVLADCTEAWQQRSRSSSGAGAPKPTVWAQMSRMKTPVIEPRDAALFTEAVQRFDDAVDAVGKGAILFAVCRGRMSEGLNFSDNRARAVVITGLPFPPIKDPQIRLKMAFLDEKLTKARSAAGLSGRAPAAGSWQAQRDARLNAARPGGAVRVHGLTGNEWYQQQASRAVNQAIGRVIRHQKDWGAIVLCDERFAATAQRDRLSKWLRSRWTVADKYGAAHVGVSRFIKGARLLFEAAPPAARKRPRELSTGSKRSENAATRPLDKTPRAAARGGGGGGGGGFGSGAAAAGRTTRAAAALSDALSDSFGDAFNVETAAGGSGGAQRSGLGRALQEQATARQRKAQQRARLEAEQDARAQQPPGAAAAAAGAAPARSRWVGWQDEAHDASLSARAAPPRQRPRPAAAARAGGGAGAQKAASGNSASKDFLKRVKDFVGSTAYDSFSKLLKPFKETAMVARKLAAVQKKALKKELAAIDARAAAAPGGAGAPSASAAAERARLVRDIKAISTHRDARRDGIFRELLESICAIFFAPRDEANDVGAAPASSRGARRGEIVASFKKFVPRAYHTLYSEVVAALERRAEGASS